LVDIDRSEVAIFQKFDDLAQHLMLRQGIAMEQEFRVKGGTQIVCVAKGKQGILMLSYSEIQESFTIGETQLDNLVHYFFAWIPRVIPIIERASLIICTGKVL
jgi:hypothetical protein